MVAVSDPSLLPGIPLHLGSLRIFCSPPPVLQFVAPTIGMSSLKIQPFPFSHLLCHKVWAGSFPTSTGLALCPVMSRWVLWLLFYARPSSLTPWLSSPDPSPPMWPLNIQKWLSQHILRWSSGINGSTFNVPTTTLSILSGMFSPFLHGTLREQPQHTVWLPQGGVARYVTLIFHLASVANHHRHVLLHLWRSAGEYPFHFS